MAREDIMTPKFQPFKWIKNTIFPGSNSSSGGDTGGSSEWWKTEDPATYVTNLYQTELGRNPYEGEYEKYWKGAIESGQFADKGALDLAFKTGAFDEQQEQAEVLEDESKPPTAEEILSGVTPDVDTLGAIKEREKEFISTGMEAFKAELAPTRERAASAAVSNWLGKGRIKSQGDAFLEATNYVDREFTRLETIERGRLSEVARSDTKADMDRRFQANLTAAGWTVQHQRDLEQMRFTASESEKRDLINQMLTLDEIEAMKDTYQAQSDSDLFNVIVTIIGSKLIGLV